MRLLLTLLTATAVLVWPGRHSVGTPAPGRDSGTNVDAEGGPASTVGEASTVTWVLVQISV